MRYKRRNPGEDPRKSEPDIYIIDPNTGQRRVMSGVEAADYAVSLQRLLADDPTYDREGSRTRASITWHINHAMRMGYPWDELKVRLSKAKRGERSNPRKHRKNPGVPAQRAGRSSLTGTVFRVVSYGTGGEVAPFPDEADRKDFKSEGRAHRYAAEMARKYDAVIPIIRYKFSKDGGVLDRAHWSSESPQRLKNPRRRNGEGWYSAAQSYLARLGAAEYAAQAKQWVKAGRSMSTFRYSPTSYHRDLVELLGKGDEEGFKARKNLEGYSTALKV